MSGLKGDEFDQSTYSGRFMANFVSMDPRLMFAGQESVDQARQHLSAYDESAKYSSEEMSKFWKSKRVISAATHPQTGELLNPACRMSAFVPLNIPICMGMLFAPPTIFNQVAWQWINQTYNASFNFANANKSTETDSTKLAKSYLLATSVSVGLSIGLNQALNRVKLAPRASTIARTLVPFFAVASAGFCNAVAMRSGELESGINIFTKDGEQLGVSKDAAKYVLINNVGMSRIALAFPILLMPPIIMGGLKASLTLSALNWKIAETAVLGACLGFAFPAALALFPSQVELPNSIFSEQEKKFVEKAGGNKIFADKGV